MRAPMLLKYLHRHTAINKIAFGGDIVDNEGDGTAMEYLWNWREAIRDLPNHHSVPGNHDDGNSVDNRWDDAFIYNYLLAAEETFDVVRGDSGLYYYIDVPAERTRYLYLDTATADGNIINDPAEETWLKEVLISTPDGWHIIAIAHIWRSVDYDVTPPADAGFSWGGKLCLDMFDAYNARSGDYSVCGGKVELCLGGHTHVDGDYFSDGGIPVVLTECDSMYVRSGLECVEGTITEAAVSAIVVNYSTQIAEIIRIGRGQSRTVKLAGNTGSDDSGSDDESTDVPEGDYTNALSTAGYTENVRYTVNDTTHEYSTTTATGWDLSGFIPCTRGDIIRLANVEFLDLDGGGGTTSRAIVYCFDANKTHLVHSASYSTSNLMSEAWAAVYNDAGNVVQFKIPTAYSSSVAYICIGARDINDQSVITVNEEIA